MNAMTHLNRSLYLVPLVTLAFIGRTAHSDDASDIRSLIPAAAAMPPFDYEKMMKNPGVTWTIDKFKDHNVTLHVMLMEKSADENAARDFAFFENRPPHPARFAAEIGRGAWSGGKFVTFAPISVIQSGRIKAFSCVVNGNVATGEVVFEAPELYKGRAEYLATRVNDKWRIAELAIPSRGIRVACEDGGVWKTQ
jgi:hypothetical protein